MIPAAAVLWAAVMLAGPDLRVALERGRAEVAISGEVTLRREGAADRTVRDPLLHPADAPLEVLPTTSPIRCELRYAAGRPATARAYRGTLRLSTVGERLVVVNVVGLEDYLRAVVPLEIGTSPPAAALQAQAVAARSYALARFGDGLRTVADFDVKNTQAYRGCDAESPATDAAVAATAGQVLQVDGQPLEAVYSACCGGLPADAAEIWGASIPGLRPGFGLPAGESWTDARLRQALRADASPCRGGDGYRWRRVINLAKLPGAPLTCKVLKRGTSGRVLELWLGPNLLRGDEIRNRLGEQDSLPSLLFALSLQGRELTLDGGGYGHGIGMCQAGAIGLAKQGQTSDEILAYYYPTAELTYAPER